MYHLLIVDDEMYEREGILHQLQWENYGVSQVDTAENGLIALRKFEENPYDIVISDVKMPVMDGLAMGLQMQDIFPDVKLLFLSGYEDFDFVKQAIQMHAFDYLLKPVGNKLEQKVKELVALLNEKYEQKRQQQTLSEANYQQQKLLGMELMDYFINEQWDLLKRILENLKYLKSSCLVLGYGTGENISDEEQKYLQTELRKYLSGISDSSLIGIWEGKMLLIFPSETILEKQCMEKIFHDFAEGLIRCGAGKYQFQYRCFERKEDMFREIRQWREDMAQWFPEGDGAFRPNSQIVSRVMDIVDERYMEDLTIKQIAEEVNYTPNYLSMIFKKECGQGFYQYLVSARMEKAKQMLKEENGKVYQVANAVGYEDPVAFIKRFRKEFGCTPTQFRNNTAGKEKKI